MNIEDKIEKSVSLFKEGYNCSQSVVVAFAEDYGFTREQALKMSASFGGGIGRMRETCGAACGLFMLAGLETGAVEGSDKEGKAANYALVQELAEEFKNLFGLEATVEYKLAYTESVEPDPIPPLYWGGTDTHYRYSLTVKIKLPE